MLKFIIKNILTSTKGKIEEKKISIIAKIKLEEISYQVAFEKMADNYTQDLNQMEHLQINSSQDQRSFQPQENNIAMSTGKSHRNHFRNDQNRQSNKINNNNRPRQNRPFKNNSRQNDNQENNNQSYTNLSTNGYTSHNEQREVKYIYLIFQNL